MPRYSWTPTFTAFFRNVSPANSGVWQYWILFLWEWNILLLLTFCRLRLPLSSLLQLCGYGKGARAVCVRCPPGRYRGWGSGENDAMAGVGRDRQNGRCRPCRACHLLHRSTLSNCTRSHNAVCGLCMDGWEEEWVVEGKWQTLVEGYKVERDW